MLGYLAILFGVIQAGLGGGAFQYMSNIKLGAWWAGIMVIISGFLALFCSTKGWTVATCVVSFVTMAITVVGAALDGESSILFRNIESCATGPSQALSANITTFGGSARYSNAAIACLRVTDSFNSGRCYCVNSAAKCIQGLQVSQTARAVDQSCRNLDNYYNYITGSAALCVICFLCVLALAITSLVALTCADRTTAAIKILTAKKEEERKDHIPPRQI
jgi:hypothetical protein